MKRYILASCRLFCLGAAGRILFLADFQKLPFASFSEPKISKTSLTSRIAYADNEQLVSDAKKAIINQNSMQHGEKTFSDDSFFHVIDPSSGNIVISRYGANFSHRFQRFPSVEERIKLYVLNWYLPPCHQDDISAIRFTDPSYAKSNESQSSTINVFGNENINKMFDISSTIKSDTMFYLNQSNILDAIDQSQNYLIRCYSNDVAELLMPAMDRIGWNFEVDPPIILQFGDSHLCKRHGSVSIPRIKKFRHAIDPNDLERIANNNYINGPCLRFSRIIPDTLVSPQTLQPIIWKLETKRHFGWLSKVDGLDKVPYSKKKNMAVFRGAMTGHQKWKADRTDQENCYAIQKCRLVMEHANSMYVDAAITSKSERFTHPDYIEINKCNQQQNSSDVYARKPEVDNVVFSNQNCTTKIYLRNDKLSLEDMLKYKAVIIMDGNDISSGLKWALYSKSVVIMSYPVLETSWAMEELLEPWVHFVPVKNDLSDLNHIVQWVLSHEKEAAYIALRGRLWIKDLVFHPNVKVEDEYIQDEILKRYRSNFYKL